MVRKKCHFCGKTFYTKGQNNRKYCSTECRKQAKYDTDRKFINKSRKQKKQQSYNKLKEYDNIPIGFTEDDTLYRYTTNADLSENPIKKNTGEIDFEKEYERILKEKKKFNLN